jgi:hypothetical protein
MSTEDTEITEGTELRNPRILCVSVSSVNSVLN